VLAASVLDPLYMAIGWILAVVYAATHSLGIAIIVMTLVVMAVQLPLITKQTRSMIVMQRVQPEIKRLQQKYKDDRQKLNEELLKFYQENKINPLAGCLPLLLIMPIGFAVFGTFRAPGIQEHIPERGAFNQLYVDLCTRDGELLPRNAPGVAEKNADRIDSCDELLDRTNPESMKFLGLDLNVSGSEAVQEGVAHALPWLVILAILIFTGWYQVRQTQARQIRQGAPINKQMQAITRVMPVFLGFISYSLNAATTLYFAVSNIWRIGQQHFILNRFYEEEEAAGGKKAAARGPGGDEAKEPPAKSGGGRPAERQGNGARRGAPSGGSGAPSGPVKGSRPSPHAARRKRKRKR
jgi:YidC/Oxa1 family membrane protein insertase